MITKDSLVGVYVLDDDSDVESTYIKKCKSAIRVTKDYWKISYLDEARLRVYLKQDITYDINTSYKDFPKEIQQVFISAGYKYVQDRFNKNKFGFYLN